MTLPSSQPSRKTLNEIRNETDRIYFIGYAIVSSMMLLPIGIDGPIHGVLLFSAALSAFFAALFGLRYVINDALARYW